MNDLSDIRARIPGDPTKTVIVSSDDISAVVTAGVLGETG